MPNPTAAPSAPFDRGLLRRRRARLGPDPDPFLRREIAARLADRLAEMRRQVRTVLELAAEGDILAEACAAAGLRPFPLHLKVDLVPPAARRAGALILVADEELLPLAPGRFDLVLAIGGLHRVNDLPGTLAQIRALLAPDGLLLAAFPGGDSLIELRSCLVEAELERAGGASPRVAPTVDPRDAAALLQRAGFASPVVDLETIPLAYRDPFRLLLDLRAMGESAVFAPALRRALRRDVLARALELYRARFSRPDGTVPATVEILFLAGFGAPAVRSPGCG